MATKRESSHLTTHLFGIVSVPAVGEDYDRRARTSVLHVRWRSSLARLNASRVPDNRSPTESPSPSIAAAFVGFRIEEKLTGLGSTTAVGRTGDVAGSIDGTTAAA